MSELTLYGDAFEWGFIVYTNNEYVMFEHKRRQLSGLKITETEAVLSG